MKMNLEEIEQRHKRTKLISAAFGGPISQGINDVDWLIAEVKRLREALDRIESMATIENTEIQKIAREALKEASHEG